MDINWNWNMYNELDRLRSKLKKLDERAQGRAPIVCTDEALRQMIKLRPQKISDFEGIDGVGKTFIDNYAEQFLNIILKYDTNPTKKIVNMNTVAAQTIKELEKKLVNINRRNRLLYLARTANKYAIDLYGTNIDPLEIAFGNRSFVVSDITLFDFDNPNDEQLKQHKRYIQLLREINKDLRDKGQNNLYLGYPFAKGRLPGENFDVRAPLALFPVIADVTPAKITLQFDKQRDPIYNNVLILACYKFNNITKPLPNNVINDVATQKFIDSLISFYRNHGINIQIEDTSIQKLVEYHSGKFPKYKPGEIYLEPCVILGKFPIHSGSIQKDFDEILDKNEINTLLNNLLSGANDIEYYSDMYAGEEEVKINDHPIEISERDLTYINDLNGSQENVISAMKVLNELVVQGPPGTGKSQTITNLIADFVSKGKTVLIVSEKKTALDVVYSRLGLLSNYALLIDDISNKDDFYNQLSHMVNSEQIKLGDDVELENISNTIDALVKRLEIISKILYTPNQLGIEPYKLYLKCKRIELTNETQREKAKIIDQLMSQSLMKLPYSAIERMHNLFSDEYMSKKISQFISCTMSYPWLASMRGDMTEFDALYFEEILDKLKITIERWRQKNFIVRLLTKGSLIADIRSALGVFFNEDTEQIQSIILTDIDYVIGGAKQYTKYQELRPLYEQLSSEELLYFQSVLKIMPFCSNSLLTANDNLTNQLLFKHIVQFESENRALFRDIDHFDGIIHALNEAIAKKQKLARNKLKKILANSIKNITTSKRYNEILRVLESKRKWSLSKFVHKFNFELFRNVKIWLLTPEAVSEIVPLENDIFDLVIFDEASQMYVEKGIPSILRAKKVVVVGDDKQLRPSNIGVGRIGVEQDELQENEEISAALEDKSLLDLARLSYQSVLLNFHYRSKYEELIAFSNYAFYKGKLYVSPNTETPKKPPIEVHKLDGAMWRERTNYAEAKYIVDMLKTFFTERKENETIGIITFNINQRDLIDDLIDEECSKDTEFSIQIRAELARCIDGEDGGLFVKNIENVQGDERDVIIFSIGYAKNENNRLIRNFGWLNQHGGENRLNVAISRAKKKVHIITSIIPSELQVEDVKNEGPHILKKYLEYAFAVSAGDKEAAKQVLLSFGDKLTPTGIVSFDSFFEEQVFDALVQRGYRVDTQVGIGGYSIDLAIKNENGYILGIECDGKLYHSSKSARERDYHRQKYLESRGWRIHRIWSTNWWKHSEIEINKICNIVGPPS